MAVDALARAIAAGKVPVDAYEMAVAGGYTGTKEQFEEDMGNSGTNATAAAASATTAANAAGNLAPAYSASATYAVGDHVLYDGGYYVCTTAITTAEAWTAAHWTAAKVGPEITDLKNALYNKTFSLGESYWQRKGLASASGNTSNSTTRISTIDYLEDDIRFVETTSGYDFAIFAWDNTDVYKGVWDGSAWVTSGITWHQNEISLKDLPGGYRYKILAKAHSGTSVTITLAECTNILFHAQVYTDSTLTVPGSPADAKAAGDAIKNLKNVIDNNLNGVSESLGVDFYQFRYGGRYLTGTDGNQGNWTDNAAWCGMLIPSAEGDTYKFKLYGGTGNTRVYQFLASDYSHISYSEKTGLQEETVTAPENTAYVIFNNRLTDLPNGYYVYKIEDGLYKIATEYLPEIPAIVTAIGETEESILNGYAAGYYWNSEGDTAVKTEYSTYYAFNPIAVNEGDKIKAYIGGPHSQKTDGLLIVDSEYSILARYGTRDAYLNYEFLCPANAAYILITAGTETQFNTDKCEIVKPTNVSALGQGLYNFSGKNVAIIGDSISTNGDYAVGNPLGNVPEIIVQEEDIGVQLSAYPTYYDIGTVIGGHEIVAADVGTELTFTPVNGDQGKIIGKPLNNNSASTYVWWEVAADALGFNPIPVCWSGSSITSHEDDAENLKTSYAWHEAQIRKCGIRTPGTMTRTAPDVIIIYRGTNDFSHQPYAKLTEGYFDGYLTGYPETDYIEPENADAYYGFCEGLMMTVGRLRTAYPSAIIILCTLNVFKRAVYDHFPTRNGFSTDYAGHATLPMYNNAIRAAANYLGCGVIEFDKDGITFENCYVDGYITDSSAHPTHPNNKGHKVMGNKAMRDLTTQINSMT